MSKRFCAHTLWGCSQGIPAIPEGGLGVVSKGTVPAALTGHSAGNSGNTSHIEHIDSVQEGRKEGEKGGEEGKTEGVRERGRMECTEHSFIWKTFHLLTLGNTTLTFGV